MTKSDALRIFIAAQDDPILAAWAAVAHEHKMSPMSDISPYEYWEAFQDLYSHGLISSHQFDGVNVRQVFFSGRRPPESEVQRVLDNLRTFSDPLFQEPPTMTRQKLPSNPFATNGNENSLTTRDSGGELAGGRMSPSLPARSASPGLNPFSQREVLPQSKDPNAIPLSAFTQNSGLACRDSAARRDLPGGRPTGDVTVRIYCCETELQMEVADMQAEGPDSIPGGQISITDRVLHGTCRICHREHHHSVGEVTHNNIY